MLNVYKDSSSLSELFTDDIQTSESEFQSDSSTNKANSSLNLLEESPINVARRQFFLVPPVLILFPYWQQD
jgi:hypothetical protein